MGRVELAAELHLTKTNRKVKIADQGHMHTSHIGTTPKNMFQLFSHLSFIFIWKSLSAVSKLLWCCVS